MVGWFLGGYRELHELCEVCVYALPAQINMTKILTKDGGLLDHDNLLDFPPFQQFNSWLHPEVKTGPLTLVVVKYSFVRIVFLLFIFVFVSF